MKHDFFYYLLYFRFLFSSFVLCLFDSGSLRISGQNFSFSILWTCWARHRIKTFLFLPKVWLKCFTFAPFHLCHSIAWWILYSDSSFRIGISLGLVCSNLYLFCLHLLDKISLNMISSADSPIIYIFDTRWYILNCIFLFLWLFPSQPSSLEFYLEERSKIYPSHYLAYSIEFHLHLDMGYWDFTDKT